MHLVLYVVALVLFVACGGDGSSTLDSGLTDAGTDDSGVATPGLSEALSCGREGIAGGLVAGTALVRYDLDLARFPNAICNDGTGARMYLRRSTSAASVNKWMIRLQGGGSCRDGQECAQRWCRYDTNFGMDKMTATLAPDAIRAGGLNSDKVENPFADWNHVLIYYCSSDSWQGQASDVVSNAEIDGENIDYLLQFHGHDIINAAIETLQRKDGQDVSYVDIESNNSMMLPDLDDAERVIFAGASAGAAGVAFNLDWIAGKLSPVPVWGVHDSNFAPRDLDYSQSAICMQEGVCDYDSIKQLAWIRIGESFWQAFLDESWVSWHQANQPEKAYRCFDIGWVTVNHLTTPVFVRMDLQDPLISANMIDSMVGIPGQGLLTEQLFAEQVALQLRALSDLQNTAVEGDAISKAPGFFGPACGKHETLGNNDAMFSTTVTIDAREWSMLELMQSWFNGEMPQGAVASSPGQGCP